MAIEEVRSTSYERLSTLKQMNKAADNPAGLAISSELLSQTGGYSAGVRNAEQSGDMLKVAEGGLDLIQDNLARIRELGVKASNGIYTDDDRRAIQMEVDQLKKSIQDAAVGTQYNTKKLLDGSMADRNLALNPDGTGMKIQMDSSTLEALGITDFDVTGTFDINVIDQAIQKVSDSRANIGSVQNALSHTVSYGKSAEENLRMANSRIVDLDVGRAVSEQQKDKILKEYSQFAKMQSIKNNNLSIQKLLGI